MNLLGVLVMQVAKLLHILLGAYTWVVIISSVLSWIRPDPYHPIVRFLSQITEPVYRAIRKRLPQSLWSTGVDFSPMILLLSILVVDTVLIPIIFQIGSEIHGAFTPTLSPQTDMTSLPQMP